MADEKFVLATVNYYGMIPFLAVWGPLTKPYRMKKSIYERLLAGGFKVKLIKEEDYQESSTIVEPTETEEVITDQTTNVENDEDVVDDLTEEETTPADEEEGLENEPEGEDESEDETVDNTDESEEEPEETEEPDEEVVDENEESSEDDEPDSEDETEESGEEDEIYSEESLAGMTKADLKEILATRGIKVDKNLKLDALKKRVLKSNPE